MKREIKNIDDIKFLVDTFYDKVRQDKLLAPVFNLAIKDKWPQHLDKMYRFWGTILLQEQSYRGNPFKPHAVLDVDENHFNRWLYLFYETLEENFTGIHAEEAKWRAEKMAEMFLMKLQYLKNSSEKTLI